MKITFVVSGSIRSNFSYRPLVLAKELKKLGHDVRIIAPIADKYNDFVPEYIADIDGVTIVQPFQFKTKSLILNLFPYMVSATVALLRQKSDLIYIYKPTPVSVIGLFAKLFYSTHIVTDFDDLGSEVMRIEGHPIYIRKLVEWSERFSARYADRLVVASTYLDTHFKKVYPNKPILILPNGAEDSWFGDVVESDAKHRIVFLGSINRKNILEPLFDALPAVIAQYPDAQVLIMGGGQFLDYFKELTKEKGIEKGVTFTGWLSIEEAMKQLKAGDIGYSYMPAGITNEAASNMKVPQYMARGVVPFVSDVGDLPRTVENGKFGYIVSSSDTKLFKKSLLNAFEDNERKQKSDNAREYSEKTLAWSKLATTFHDWINHKHTQKKVYVVATSVPGNTGGRDIRNYNLIKQLSSKSEFDVTVFCISHSHSGSDEKYFEMSGAKKWFISPGNSSSILRIIKSILIERVPPFMSNFRANRISTIFRQECEKCMPDVVHVEQLQGYYCIQKHIPWLKKHGVKIVLDCHNIEYQALEDVLHSFPIYKQIAGKFVLSNFKHIEIEAARFADIVLACSHPDLKYFKEINPSTYLVTNGVDTSDFKVHGEGLNHTVIFMGGVEYPPNSDAVLHYIEHIHHLVKSKIPHYKLLLVGTNGPWLASKGITDESITPLGFVEDVRTYLAESTVGICPVRFGSGTRIKIMTYMAAGLPVVAMKKGAEGVEYTHGENIVITDDSVEFAESVVRLMTDTEYNTRMSKHAKDFIVKNYDWDVIGNTLIDAYNRI